MPTREVGEDRWRWDPSPQRSESAVLCTLDCISWMRAPATQLSSINNSLRYLYLWTMMVLMKTKSITIQETMNAIQLAIAATDACLV
ncbi:hypothetical protein TNIN_185561 [Trichonephila inaurata madagascariensis]|uniref:Uncharacterized protein n=1 Tax=Trichonephila inaurata madagascariensis TaxID=2747483 RepID=A0A8X6KK63_9ARAC|nr:hypothetical protein TNIN_185561 [Trichonephila inaurata madagascariensis]